MPNVLSTKSASIAMVQVANLEVLENIQANFEVYTVPSQIDECIIDSIHFEGEDGCASFQSFLDILGLEPGDELAKDIETCRFILLHA